MAKYLTINNDVYIRNKQTGVISRPFVAGMDVDAVEVQAIDQDVKVGKLEYYDLDNQTPIENKPEVVAEKNDPTIKINALRNVQKEEEVREKFNTDTENFNKQVPDHEPVKDDTLKEVFSEAPVKDEDNFEDDIPIVKEEKAPKDKADELELQEKSAEEFKVDKKAKK